MPIVEEFNNCHEVRENKGVASCYSCVENHYPIKYLMNTRRCINLSDWSLDPQTN